MNDDNFINNEHHVKELRRSNSCGAFCLEDYLPEAKKIIAEKIEEYREDLRVAEALEKRFAEHIYMNVPKQDETLAWLLFDKYIWEKLTNGREKNIARLERLQNTKKGGGGIDEAQVMRAKEFPIDDLIHFKNKCARCIWHEGGKSTSLRYYPKDNTVYCFSCAKHGDSIDVYQTLFGCDFISAVKALQ